MWADVAALVPDEEDLKAEIISRGKEEHFTVTKESNFQEDMIINMDDSKYKTSKYTK